MIQRGGSSSSSGLVARGFFAVATRGRCGLEDLAPCVEPRKAIRAIAGRALGHGIQTIGDEHDVDADNVGELTCLLAVSASPAQYPSHHAERSLLTEQRHWLRRTKELIREGDSSLSLTFEVTG